MRVLGAYFDLLSFLYIFSRVYPHYPNPLKVNQKIKKLKSARFFGIFQHFNFSISYSWRLPTLWRIAKKVVNYRYNFDTALV